jgi:hypothetical protein
MDRDNSYIDLADVEFWLVPLAAEYEPIRMVWPPVVVLLPPLEIPTRVTSPHQ